MPHLLPHPAAIFLVLAVLFLWDEFYGFTALMAGFILFDRNFAYTHLTISSIPVYITEFALLCWVVLAGVRHRGRWKDMWLSVPPPVRLAWAFFALAGCYSFLRGLCRFPAAAVTATRDFALCYYSIILFLVAWLKWTPERRTLVLRVLGAAVLFRAVYVLRFDPGDVLPFHEQVMGQPAASSLALSIGLIFWLVLDSFEPNWRILGPVLLTAAIAAQLVRSAWTGLMVALPVMFLALAKTIRPSILIRRTVATGLILVFGAAGLITLVSHNWNVSNTGPAAPIAEMSSPAKPAPAHPAEPKMPPPRKPRIEKRPEAPPVIPASAAQPVTPAAPALPPPVPESPPAPRGIPLPAPAAPAVSGLPIPNAPAAPSPHPVAPQPVPPEKRPAVPVAGPPAVAARSAPPEKAAAVPDNRPPIVASQPAPLVNPLAVSNNPNPPVAIQPAPPEKPAALSTTRPPAAKRIVVSAKPAARPPAPPPTITPEPLVTEVDHAIWREFLSLFQGLASKNVMTRVWLWEDALSEVFGVGLFGPELRVSDLRRFHLPIPMIRGEGPFRVTAIGEGFTEKVVNLPILPPGETRPSLGHWLRSVHRVLFGIPMGKPFLPPQIIWHVDTPNRFDPHNSLIAVFYRMGFLGWVSLIALVTSVLTLGWPDWREGAVSRQLFRLAACGSVVYFLAHTLTDNTLENPFKGLWFWALLGLLLVNHENIDRP